MTYIRGLVELQHFLAMKICSQGKAQIMGHLYCMWVRFFQVEYSPNRPRLEDDFTTQVSHSKCTISVPPLTQYKANMTFQLDYAIVSEFVDPGTHFPCFVLVLIVYLSLGFCDPTREYTLRIYLEELKLSAKLYYILALTYTLKFLNLN